MEKNDTEDLDRRPPGPMPGGLRHIWEEESVPGGGDYCGIGFNAKQLQQLRELMHEGVLQAVHEAVVAGMHEAKEEMVEAVLGAAIPLQKGLVQSDLESLPPSSGASTSSPHRISSGNDKKNYPTFRRAARPRPQIRFNKFAAVAASEDKDHSAFPRSIQSLGHMYAHDKPATAAPIDDVGSTKLVTFAPTLDDNQFLNLTGFQAFSSNFPSSRMISDVQSPSNTETADSPESPVRETFSIPRESFDSARTFEDLDVMQTEKLLSSDVSAAMPRPTAYSNLSLSTRSFRNFNQHERYENKTEAEALEKQSASNGDQTQCTLSDPSNKCPARLTSFDMKNLRVDQEMSIMESTFNVATHQASLVEVANSQTCPSKCWTLLLPLPQLALGLFGVIPMHSSLAWFWYENCIQLVIMVLIALFAMLGAPVSEFAYTHLTDVVYGFGGIVAVLSLNRVQNRPLLALQNKALNVYAINHGFMAAWMNVSQCSFLAVLVMWICELALQACVIFKFENQHASTTGGNAPFRFLCFVLSSGLFSVLAYCQMHVCFCLRLMVDEFNLSFFKNPDIQHSVCKWNVVQAVLRWTARVIDSCFLVTQTSLLIALSLLISDILFLGKQLNVWVVLPVLPKCILSFSVFYMTSTVTEKCLRTPALINSLIATVPTEDGRLAPTDPERQYIVQFIQNSAAGFYVKGARVTSSMVIKVGYMIMALIFTLAARTATVSNAQ